MTEVKINAVLLFKKGTKAELEASSSIPREGEPIFETDTGRLKVGDGVSAYANLSYVDKVQVVSDIGPESGDNPASAAAVYTYGQSIKNYADGRFVTQNSAISNALLRIDEAEANAKAYTNKVKTDILGEGITETFDTLVEIQDWINGEGINATELTAAIAEEARLREAGDNAVTTNMNTKVSEMQTEYRAIEPNLKAYVDQKIGEIENGAY